MFDQITIIGPGLLGASLLQAAKNKALCKRTAAWSRRPETRLKCEKSEWCDQVFSTAKESVQNADLVVICTPVDTIVSQIEALRSHLKPGAIVTDVGSTKSLICRHAHAVMPEGCTFVGSHPMAGSEKTGLENAFPELFEKHTCIITPLVDTNPESADAIARFWSELGMEVASVSPESHDEIVAHISHLPHLLASVLCSYLDRKDNNWANYAAGGLRDTTRIASGDASLWKSIILQNKEEILRSIQGFEQEMDRVRAALHNDNPFEILNVLERGKRFRDALRPILTKNPSD